MNTDNVIPIELLAPAKNTIYGIEAVKHGADALYIGAPAFGARSTASNSINDLAELIHFAHIYKARVYITMNTLLYDSELEEAEKLIKQIYSIGADGLIIQDMGILELDIPPIPLIASTQAHVNTIEKVLFFEKIGFKRIILPRECSLSEVESIRKGSSIELESFVHGALCVSFSGQCNLSQVLCNRSGNRGVCAQPCRSRYDLLDNDGKYIARDKFLMSMKDLNLSEYMEDMLKVGISSFKIEGRLKDITYVKNIVSFYRQKLDLILSNNSSYAKSSIGKHFFHFEPDPAKSFNRGFTIFAIDGKKRFLSTYHTQKAIGKSVGIVVKISKSYFESNNKELNKGDGICFYDENTVLNGTQIISVEENRIYPESMVGLQIGTEIFCNKNIEFERVLNMPSAERKIGLNIFFSVLDNYVILKLKDEVDREIIVKRKFQFVKADKSDQIKAHIINQLIKLGNTPFYLLHFTFEGEMVPFLLQSFINTLRRDAIELLLTEIERNYQKGFIPFTKTIIPFPDKQLTYLGNVMNEKARQFYLRHGTTVIEMAIEKSGNYLNKVVMITKHCLKFQNSLCPVFQNAKKQDGPLFLKDNNHRYKLTFDCKRCEMTVIFEK